MLQGGKFISEQVPCAWLLQGALEEQGQRKG